MLTKYNYIFFLLVSSSLFGQMPTAEELLEKHHKASEKLQSYICNYEFEQHSRRVTPGRRNLNGERDTYRSVEIRWDGPGERGKLIRNRWGDVSRLLKDIEEENRTYGSTMWDGKAWYQFSKSMLPGKTDLLTIIRGKTSLNLKNWNSIGWVDPFFSIAKRGGVLKDELANNQIKKIRVANKTSKVGDTKCYVIEGTHTNGTEYIYWIDPEHDYQIARSVLRKKAGFDDGVFPIAVQFTQTLQFSDFKEIDGAWIPMTTTERNKSFNKEIGSTSEGKSIYKRTRVTLDPDHDALGSFLPDDITNGSTVVLVIGARSLRFSWHNGAVVDKDGQEVDADRLIKAESEKVKKSKPKRK